MSLRATIRNLIYRQNEKSANQILEWRFLWHEQKMIHKQCKQSISTDCCTIPSQGLKSTILENFQIRPLPLIEWPLFPRLSHYFLRLIIPDISDSKMGIKGGDSILYALQIPALNCTKNASAASSSETIIIITSAIRKESIN